MITVSQLRGLSLARQEDASGLHQAGRYDAAIYLSGYAVELALKARICETLGWIEFPSTRGEFRSYQSLQTHELAILLEFSGIKRRVNTENPAAWKFVVENWGAHLRYLPVDSADVTTCSQMPDAVALLLEVI
jgi:hypothetical protein